MRALISGLVLAATLAAHGAAARVPQVDLPEAKGVVLAKGFAKAGKPMGKRPSVTFAKPRPRAKGPAPKSGKITGPNRPRIPRPWPPGPKPKPKPGKPAKGDPPPKRPLAPPGPKWKPPGI